MTDLPGSLPVILEVLQQLSGTVYSSSLTVAAGARSKNYGFADELSIIQNMLENDCTL